MRFREGVAYLFSSSVASFILQFLSGILLARMLKAAGKGEFAVILLFPSLCLYMFNFGVSAGVRYYVGHGEHEGRQVVGSALIFVLAAALLCWTAVLLFHGPLTGVILRGLPLRYLLIGAAVFPFTLVPNYLNGVLVVRDRNRAYGLLELVNLSVLCAGLAVTWLFIPQKLVGAVGSWCCAALIAAGASLIVIGKSEGISMSLNPELIRRMLRYGVEIAAMTFILFLNYRLDILMVNYFLKKSDVGVYSLAVGVAQSLWLLPTSISHLIFARTSTSTAADANAFTPVVCRHSLILVWALCVPVALISRPLIPLIYGDDFRASYDVLVVLLPGVAVFSLFKVLASDIAARGLPLKAAIPSLCSLPVNACLNLLLIPVMGTVGAAVATTASYCVVSLLVLKTFSRISGVRPRECLLLTKGDLRYALSAFRRAS